MGIPDYFYDLFTSVETLEQYLKISYDELIVTKLELNQLKSLSSSVLVVTQVQNQSFYSRWQNYNNTNGLGPIEASTYKSQHINIFVLKSTMS